MSVNAGLTGDYNENSVVDAADYIVWRKSLNTTNALPNDATPGIVAQDDYNFWRAGFGRMLGAGVSISTSTAVPEPIEAMWTAAVSAAMLIRRRRYPNSYRVGPLKRMIDWSLK
jgi:hypothetical protein